MDTAPNDEITSRLGDLLIQAGLLDSRDLVEALQVSQRLAAPLGRVLLAADCITPHILDAGLQAQSLVRKGLSLRSATEALKMAADRSIPFIDARHEVDQRETVQSPIKRLGEILLGAGIANRAQLDAAFMESAANNMSFGHTLVEHAVLSPSILTVALQQVDRVVNGQVSLSDAISNTREAHGIWSRAKASIKLSH